MSDRSELPAIGYPGNHEPLVNRATFDRVQVLLGEQKYQSHDLVYGCERIKCGHCGHPITGESKTKKTKNGPKQYVYYRCAKYNGDAHPRTRLREDELDEQVLALFDRMRVKNEKVRAWFDRVLRAKTRDDQEMSRERITELNRQLTSLRNRDRSIRRRSRMIARSKRAALASIRPIGDRVHLGQCQQK